MGWLKAYYKELRKRKNVENQKILDQMCLELKRKHYSEKILEIEKLKIKLSELEKDVEDLKRGNFL